ncbi:hypothetical protein B0H17DRAFT_1078967 [Mycena rosella]|uniref:Uncharacterized protein n=1 Tax=Mycena rosella TaxID=1033263 RepID=A0AAD7D3Z0_MYCRO|nr:hypothetical protein B0H17DRAFT_1078967 [Mycena rosella]
MSTTASTDEIIYSLGALIYRDNVPHSVGFIFYGIYFVFFCAYLWFIIRHSTAPRASKILLAAMLLLFLSTTAQFAADMVLNLAQIRGYLMWTGVPLAERRALWLQRYEPAYVLEKWPTLNFMISDAIVIWRASVMYGHRRWAQVALWAVAFADVVIWAYAFALTSRDTEQRSHNPATDQKLITISFFISLGTNLLGTGAIAWKHRRLVAQKSFLKWKRSEVTRILLLLVETGAIWAVIQLTATILLQIDTEALSALDLATAVMQKVEVYLAAILPTATVLIVRLHRFSESTMDLSAIQTPGASNRTPSTLLSTIHFEDSPPGTKRSGVIGAELVQPNSAPEPGRGNYHEDQNTAENRPTPKIEEMV